MYKYKTNVKKIVDAWGFQNNGYISNSQIKNIAKDHFHIDMSQIESDALVASFNRTT